MSNPMREIRIEKVTLNIGVGSPGDKLDKSVKLLKSISGSKPVQTMTNERIPTWGLRPKLPIATKVTVRGKKAEELLRRLLAARENKLDESKFDNFGNVSFGIPEYIDIPDVAYDASIGVIGLEVAVTFSRPGYRIKRRFVLTRKIPKRHSVTKTEALAFMKSKFNVDFGEEEQ